MKKGLLAVIVFFLMVSQAFATWTASGETIFSFSGFSPPWVGYAPAWQPTTGYIKAYTGASGGQDANTNFPQQLSAGNIKQGVTSGTATGTVIEGGAGAY